VLVVGFARRQPLTLSASHQQRFCFSSFCINQEGVLSRYLLCLLLVALTGCSFGDWRHVQSGTSDLSESAGDDNSVGSAISPDCPEDSAQPGATDEVLLEETTVETVTDEGSAPLDPETLEDMQLLTDKDLAPPEDEGKSDVEDEVEFDLPVVENDKVRYFINYFTGQARQGFTRWLERSGRYLPMMQKVFAEEGLPQDLAYLPMIESGFNARAYSRARAVGLWQFMESTGRIYNLHNDWWKDERRDPLKATRAAASHLGDLYRRFGDWYLALAAYNAGAGKVDRAIRMFGSRDFWQISRGRYLKTETKNYLPKFLAALIIAKEPAKYGFVDLNYHPPLAYDTAELPGSTDLDIIARLCNVPYEEIRDLNPELKRWCTPPGVAGYPVRLPAEKEETFLGQYAEIPPDRRANFRRHRIRSGDTLGGLAARYRIRTRDIVALNGIRNPRTLRIGRDLILPLRPGATLAPDVLEDGYVRNRQRSYKVRKGDTLWDIARKFRVSTGQLCAWNGLNRRGVLRPGQVLKVAGNGGRPVSTRKGVKYRVRSGDTLWDIARKFRVTTGQLCAWNGLSKRGVLRPGQVLLVAGSGGQDVSGQEKVVYQVRSGDTLWDIGRRFNLKTRDIIRWNNLKANAVLRPGDRLTLMLSGDRRG
jgi:membrane-bound lytic murein transglycosylase D